MSNAKGRRFTIIPGEDNTDAIVHRENTPVPYAATINLEPQSSDSEFVRYFIGLLTGALSLVADILEPHEGDEMMLVFHADGTNRVVTFSTGFISAGTITVLANKTANAYFIYDQTMPAWVETSRFVQS